MIWERLRGHADQAAMFRRCVARERLAHGYLFVGPEGVGKKLFVRLLAQCLFCTRIDDDLLDACGECDSCRQMQAGTHADFLTVGCPEGKSELPLELLVGTREHRGREGLCYELALRPLSGARKIAVIDDANKLNPQGANALLKTLEEPPSYALLFLIAENRHGILPTIRSRCQQIRFGPLSRRDVTRLLGDLSLAEDDSEAETVAVLCDGSMAVAEQLLNPGLRKLRALLYEGLASEPFRPGELSAQVLAALDDLGGDTPTQRRHAIWLVRFGVEFYRRTVANLSGQQAEETNDLFRRFSSRFEPASSADIEFFLTLADRSLESQQQLDRMAPVAICLEGLFDELGRRLRVQTC
jgi:DNA polymerase-3 subunit delta'